MYFSELKGKQYWISPLRTFCQFCSSFLLCQIMVLKIKNILKMIFTNFMVNLRSFVFPWKKLAQCPVTQEIFRELINKWIFPKVSFQLYQLLLHPLIISEIKNPHSCQHLLHYVCHCGSGESWLNIAMGWAVVSSGFPAWIL